jgi:repressor LexA
MSSVDTLTDRQRAVLDFVQTEVETNGMAPTVREIQHHFGLRSPNSVQQYLVALQEKGLIRPNNRRARGNLPVGMARNGWTDIPLLGAIPAGLPVSSEQVAAPERLRVDLTRFHAANPRETYALRVSGDSMTGAHIMDGDIAIIARREARNGDIVAALVDGESTLKRLDRLEDGTPVLKAENPRYPNLVPAEDLSIQGVMVGLVRTTH